jgi:ribose 5-phosphate isomerase A
MDADAQKRAAAEAALFFVSDGMRLGLGTGSTAAHFVDVIGEQVARGLNVLCVPTSEATRRQAESLAIPLTTLDQTPHLDLTVDGADEIGPGLALIKGGGGAHLREKIVAAASDQLVIIADASKRVDTLGAFPLPLEITPFGARATVLAVNAAAADMGLSGEIVQRKGADGEAFVSDNANLIFDCHFGRIEDPKTLARALADVPGLVEHGLFVAMASAAVVAGPDGVETLRP